MPFPKDFSWGAATASYQIEGAVQEGGRGESIWDRFSHTPGKIENNDTGDVACDHYHRYPDDIALMKALGLGAYRFSVAWPRVIPAGTGATNPAGLDFYDKLVDELLRAGIQPFLTLYHWDLPQALQDRGGWTNPDSLDWFVEYTDLMTRHLGDRVKHWITFNEPWVVAFLGYMMGIHAPGLQDAPMTFRVAHHVLLAHGKAVPVIRQNVPDAQAGITIDMSYFEPASSSEEDAQTVRIQDGFRNRWFLDPVFKGSYPADTLELLKDTMKDVDVSGIQSAAVPIDFLGLNYYTRTIIGAHTAEPLKPHSTAPEDSEYTAMGWEVYPEGLRRLLLRLKQEYAPKAIYITENGAAFDDPTTHNGVVEDPERTRYLERHFAAAEQAIAEGVPLKGYFVWSLMDNFEWSFGYARRFGIVHVDFATQQRTLKQSALWYQQKIKSENGAR